MDVNPGQEDGDNDGAGDVCDDPACSNGFLEPGEECDDGNTTDGDGCSATCETEYCRDDAPLNDTTKNFVVTDLTSWLIAWTSSQANSKVAICFEDTSGSRDVFYINTDAIWAFNYLPNLAPYSWSPWINIWIMLHDENDLDIDHHALMIAN